MPRSRRGETGERHALMCMKSVECFAGILGARGAVDISIQWRQNRRESEGRNEKLTTNLDEL